MDRPDPKCFFFGGEMEDELGTNQQLLLLILLNYGSVRYLLFTYLLTYLLHRKAFDSYKLLVCISSQHPKYSWFFKEIFGFTVSCKLTYLFV